MCVRGAYGSLIVASRVLACVSVCVEMYTWCLGELFLSGDISLVKFLCVVTSSRRKTFVKGIV